MENLLQENVRKNNEIDEKQIDSYVHLVHNLGFDILIFATMKNEWKDKINNYLIDKKDKFISNVGAKIICLDVKNENLIPIKYKEVDDIYEIKLESKELKDVFNNGRKLSILSEQSHFKTRVLWDRKYIRKIIEYIDQKSESQVSDIIQSYYEKFSFSENLIDKIDNNKIELFVYLNYRDSAIDLYECKIDSERTYEEIIQGKIPICRLNISK